MMTGRPHERTSGCKGIAEILKTTLTLHPYIRLWFSGSEPVQGSPKNIGKHNIYIIIQNSGKISYEIAMTIISWLGSPQHEELC